MLLEQSSGWTFRKLKSAGYIQLDKPPVDFTPSTYSRIRFEGKWWYKKGEAVNAPNPQTPNPPVPNPVTNVDLSQYVGSYKEGLVKGDVTENNGVLRINFKSMDTYLDSKGSDIFEFEFGTKATVKFTRDNQGKVTGFDYKYSLLHGHADKVDSTPTTPTPPKPDSTTNNTTTTTDAPIPQKITYTKYNDNPSERANTKGFRWKKCDETFPIKYGCANNLIKDLNTCIFGENSSNVYGPALLNSLNDRARDTPNKEISKETYDALIAQCEAKNESINKKKIIKETVRNILKESLLNN